MANFGENLKKIREINNISQKHLAKLMGISQQRVSEWECGKVEPTLHSFLLLMKVLGATFDELTDNIKID